MKRTTRTRFGFATTTLVIAAALLLQSLSYETQAVPGGAVEVNLSAEVRALNAYLSQLVSYEQSNVLLSKKAFLTGTEFDAQKRIADQLKASLPGIQSALRDAIQKLKAANLFDNLDQTMLARISDTRFQRLLRQDSFKRTLEETARDVSGEANELTRSLDTLRAKVRAGAVERELRPGASSLASRVVRVGYEPAAPAMFLSVRCSLAYIRGGFSGAFLGSPSDRAINGVLCFCDGDPKACSSIFSPT